MTEPWELLGMDLIGKLTRTPHGNQYICTIIDYFTKWAIAFPLKNKSSPEVVQCITKLFYLFGAPKRILTDQGKEFCNKVYVIFMINICLLCVHSIISYMNIIFINVPLLVPPLGSS